MTVFTFLTGRLHRNRLSVASAIGAFSATRLHLSAMTGITHPKTQASSHCPPRVLLRACVCSSLGMTSSRPINELILSWK